MGNMKDKLNKKMKESNKNGIFFTDFGEEDSLEMEIGENVPVEEKNMDKKEENESEATFKEKEKETQEAKKEVVEKAETASEVVPKIEPVKVDPVKVEEAKEEKIEEAENEMEKTFEDILNVIEKNKKAEKKMTGIYFDDEVIKALDKLAKKDGSRGAKSRIVNDILKVAFKQMGVLK